MYEDLKTVLYFIIAAVAFQMLDQQVELESRNFAWDEMKQSTVTLMSQCEFSVLGLVLHGLQNV